MDVTCSLITTELHSQEPSIPFLFELDFFGMETFPKFIDIFFFGAPE
jgi:hypothetical protein